MKRVLMSGVLVALVLTLPACVYDGVYLVEGRVRSCSGDLVEPLRTAEVVTRGGPTGTAQKTVRTGEAGAYRTEYHHGGIGFLFWKTGAGDPWVEFTASGHQSRRVRLTSEKPQEGVTRRECEQQGAARCYGLDVVLWPDPAHRTSSCATIPAA